MPEEEKVRGRKKKQQRKKANPRKLEILDAYFALGKACGFVGDFDDMRRFVKRAKDGYEEQLGRNSEKALETTHGLIMCTASEYSHKHTLMSLSNLGVVYDEGVGVLRESFEWEREYVREDSSDYAQRRDEYCDCLSHRFE